MPRWLAEAALLGVSVLFGWLLLALLIATATRAVLAPVCAVVCGG